MKILQSLLVFIAFSGLLYSCRPDHETESCGMESVSVKIKLNLKVGSILYQDTDAIVSVRGFDSGDHEAWRQEFDYDGPYANLFTLKSGYHHYTMEVKKFGISDNRTFTAQQVRDGRADGPTPVVFVLGGAVAPKMLSHSITYVESPDKEHPGNTVLIPDGKVEYHYNANLRVDTISYYIYSVAAKEFEIDHYSAFTYDHDNVEKITRFNGTGPVVNTEYSYQYQENGRVSQIKADNRAAGVETEATFAYTSGDSTVNARYSSSNGRSFQYNFIARWGNIVSDKVTEWGQTCNEGSYAHDKNLNPLKHLGYIDFNLQNYSINNVLTETVNYLACSFPEVVPESHQVEYDKDGYPVLVNTKYKKPDRADYKTQTRYFYME